MKNLDFDGYSYCKDSIRTLTSEEMGDVAGGSTPACLTPTLQLTTLSSEWCREQAEKLTEHFD